MGKRRSNALAPPGSAFAPFVADTKKKTLKQLSREDASGSELQVVLDEINASSDRAAGLLIAIQVQDSLGTLIRGHLKRTDDNTMKELESQGCPFGSFNSMIVLGYAMGLIEPEERKTLNIIRNIRNAFAHAKKPLYFHTPEVSAECDKFKNPDELPDARNIYMQASFQLARDLLMRTSEHHKQRMKEADEMRKSLLSIKEILTAETKS